MSAEPPADLSGLSEVELLDAAAGCATAVRRAEADLLRIAYQWAVGHGADRLDPGQVGLPGGERATRLGGDGVPLVCEFAAAELGARIGKSPAAGAALMADAVDLVHRLPALWARVRGYEVAAGHARYVARATRELTVEEALLVDAAVAPSADGRLGWSRFTALVEGQVAAAAPAAARAKEERAAKARFAKRLRCTDPDTAHGMASFLVRADVATIAEIDAVVTAVAAAMRPACPNLPADELRLRALLLLLHAKVDPDDPDPDDLDADPGDPGERGDDTAMDLADLTTDRLHDLMPTVQLYVHMYADDLGVGADPRLGHVARVEGHGPVTAAWVREQVGRSCRFRITPVLDLAGQAPVDAYEIPDRHRQAVHLMTPADVFPYAANLDRGKQIDHTIPYDHTTPDRRGSPPGQSAIGNYGPMTTRHHRIKTHGRWQVRQPFPGIYLWRDPHGTHYLVDHTGTHRLRPTDEATTPAPTPPPRVVEIYRPLPRLDHDLAS